MYHSDDARLDKIEQIMTQAFGIAGRTLADVKADELLPGWIDAFRTVPTEHLERVRTEGLALRCTTADQFVAVFEARMRKEFAVQDFHSQQARFDQEREQAVQPGESSPARDRFKARWGTGAAQ